MWVWLELEVSNNSEVSILTRRLRGWVGAAGSSWTALVVQLPSHELILVPVELPSVLDTLRCWRGSFTTKEFTFFPATAGALCLGAHEFSGKLRVRAEEQPSLKVPLEGGTGEGDFDAWRGELLILLQRESRLLAGGTVGVAVVCNACWGPLFSFESICCTFVLLTAGLGFWVARAGVKVDAVGGERGAGAGMGADGEVVLPAVATPFGVRFCNRCCHCFTRFFILFASCRLVPASFRRTALTCLPNRVA